MDNILDHVIFDNTLRSYLVVAAVTLLAILFKRYLSRYIAGLLFRLIHKLAKGVDKASFINLVMAPLRTFLIILITIVTFEKLNFPTSTINVLGLSIEPNFTIYKISLKQLIETLSIVVLILSFIWLLLRIIDFVAMILEQKANLTADQTDNQLIVFFKDFFKVLLVINGFLMILKFGFGFNIGSIITGLSIAGAAIALATRESLENLIASFIIFFDKPFNTGDLGKVNGFTGTIEKIGLRSTRIRTLEKTYISVPNKQMVDTIVDNISLRTHRKAEIKIEIGLDATTNQLTALIDAIRSFLSEKQLEGISVHLVDTGKNAHVINIEYLQSVEQPMQEFLQDKQENMLQIIAKMESLKIQMAGAATDVVVTNKSTV